MISTPALCWSFLMRRTSCTFTRLRDLALSAQALIAGPAPDLTARIHAAQVYAALSDPIIIFADHPANRTPRSGPGRSPPPPRPPNPLESTARQPPRPPRTPRPHAAPRSPAPTTGRGRPTAMTPDMIESARRMRDSGTRSIDAIAAAYGVSRATLYRHLATPTDRTTT